MNQPLPWPDAEIMTRSLQIRPDFLTSDAFAGNEQGHILTFVPEHLTGSHGLFMGDLAGMDTQNREGSGARDVKTLVHHALYHRSDLPIRSVRSQTSVYNSNNPRHDAFI